MAGKLKVGIVGLGRLGMEYANILKFKIYNVELIAACSISNKELEVARSKFDLPYLFQDFDEMLQLEIIDVIFILSTTSLHAEHILKALDRGKHVFSEKPLASDIATCQTVIEKAEEHPELKCVVGFVRRFDPSYRHAKKLVLDGKIGKPFLVRSQTVDKDTQSNFQIEYVGKSGGIFHDFNVHDIDLARWFLESEIKNVHAIGGAYKYSEFEKAGDADNVMTMCQFENGTMAIINASRTAMHGHDTYTEIVGTEGTLRIGRPANKNRIEIYDKFGARQECVETFWDRFESAFQIMIEEYVNCVLQNKTFELRLSDALKATEAASAFTKSFREKRIVVIQ